MKGRLPNVHFMVVQVHVKKKKFRALYPCKYAKKVLEFVPNCSQVLVEYYFIYISYAAVDNDTVRTNTFPVSRI